MRAKVSEKGVIIPKEFLDNAEEVDIHKKDNIVIVIARTQVDPILELGKYPVSCGLPDASEHHDIYIYDPSL